MLAENTKTQQIRLLSPDQQLQVFGPELVRGYGLRGQPIIASTLVRRVDGSLGHHFVLAQLSGPASLYSFMNETGLLLRPPGPAADTLYELSSHNWRLLFNRHLTDCPTIRMSDARVLNLPFEERYIRLLLTRYNYCLAPDWKPASSARTNAYRKGLELETDFGYIHFKHPTYDQPESGTSQRLLLALTFLRASGLQSGIGLGYTRMAYRSGLYTNDHSSQGIVTEQFHGQTRLLTGLIRVGKRMGKIDRPNLLLGLELGFNYNLRSTGQTYQPPPAGGRLVKVEQSTDTGGVLPHAVASAGIVFPLASQREVRVSAAYQHFLLSGFTFVWGLQAAYSLFRN